MFLAGPKTKRSSDSRLVYCMSVDAVAHRVHGCIKVKCITNDIERDTIRENADVLTPAILHLGLRVSVATCQVHVRALYDLMKIACPGALMYYRNTF